MKRLIPVFILLVAAIAAGLYFYPRLTRKSAPANQLALSGNIEAHESLVSFKVQGRIVDLPVEEGQQVEQGALLARLEDADFKQKVRIDEAGVNVRESNLALTLAGTREQEVKASAQAVADAQADLNEKKLDSDRAQQLFAKDEISAQDRDLASTAFKRSEATFKAARQRLNEAEEGSRKEDIAIARANLAQANADLGLSRINETYTTLQAPSAGVVTVRQTLAKFIGDRRQPSRLIRIPASGTRDASLSSRLMRNSHRRACRQKLNASPSSIASRLISIIPTMSSSQACPLTPTLNSLLPRPPPLLCQQENDESEPTRAKPGDHGRKSHQEFSRRARRRRTEL
jgi:multidrug efflux pump subunit AcrA (membrane-fusion protein)